MNKQSRANRKLQAEMLEPRHLLNGDIRFVAGPTEFGGNGRVEIYDRSDTATGDAVYFNARSETAASVLWRTQGQTNGTNEVLDSEGNLLRNPTNGLHIGHTFYVQADNALWRIPGATSNATKVPLPDGVTPAGPMAELNGVLYFPAQSDTLGVELWRTDGVNAANTRVVKDIATLGLSSDPDNFIVFNNRLFFTAYDAEHGQEWRYTDGTATGTKLLKDISAGQPQRIFTEAEVVGNRLYFTQLNRLWITDGTTAGTRVVSTLVDYPSELTAVGNTLYFSASVNRSNRELWKTDGTSAGTEQVKDIYPGDQNSHPYGLTNVNGMLYFSADGGSAKGHELWVSDGTALGTKLVRDLNNSQLDSQLDNFTNVNGTLYFTARIEDTTRLYKSDGTLFGTYKIPGNVNFVRDLVVVGNSLYFAAGSTEKAELYIVDTSSPVSPAKLSVTKNLSNGRIEISGNTSSGNDDFLLVERNGANLVITETGKRPLQIMNFIPNTVTVQGRRLVIPMEKIENSGQPLVIGLGLGNDKITLDTNGDTGDIFPKTGLSLDFFAGSDLLDLADNTTTNTWTMSGNRSGNLRVGNLGGASFHNLENARGGAGVDNFNVAFDSAGKYITLDGEAIGANNALSFQRDADLTLLANRLDIEFDRVQQSFRIDNIQQVSLTGGVSGNVLDATAFPGKVILSGREGNDILLGGRNDDTLFGGAGADWLAGNLGNDTLHGETGLDILSGGRGTDFLSGGEGEDILTGGDPFRSGESEIRNFLSAWIAAGTYQSRVQKLASQIHSNNDDVADTMFGNGGLDWFFADPSAPGDEIDVPNVGLLDRITGEKVTNI
jgi:ELWxxDGT repeat protein